MTCAEIGGLLDRLLDGELSEAERRELEAHGETCPACAAEIRAALQMKALFEEMEPEVDVPLEVQARWRRAVREDAAQRRRKRLTRWIGSAAAALVVLVGVGLALNGGLSPKRDSAAIMPAGERAAEVEVVSEAQEESQSAALGEEPSGVALVETDGAGEAAPAVEVESAGEAAPAVEADSAGEASPMAGGSAGEAAPAVEADSANEAPPVMEIDGAYEAQPMTADSAYEAQPDDMAGEAYESAEADGATDAKSAPMVVAEANESAAMPMATAEPMADAMQAGSSDADCDDAAQDDDALAEDMEAAEEAVAAPLSPACELNLQVSGVETICLIVSELAADFDATVDVQTVEDGSANVYVMIDAAEAPAFMDAVLRLDESEAKPAVPDVAETGTVQILLVLKPVD